MEGLILMQPTFKNLRILPLKALNPMKIHKICGFWQNLRYLVDFGLKLLKQTFIEDPMRKHIFKTKICRVS